MRDSFVFIDYNSVECAEVEAGCPGVLVVPAPAAMMPRSRSAQRSSVDTACGIVHAQGAVRGHRHDVTSSTTWTD